MNSILSRRVVVESSSRLTKLLWNPISHSHPNQSRHLRTHYLPSSPPVTRFEPCLLWRRPETQFVKLRSRVGFSSFRFPKKGLPFSGFETRGWKHWLQGLSANDVVLGLIAANTGVFFMWRLFDQQFMTNNFMISLDNFRSGRVHTLITSAFSHIDFGHIISNMIGLYFFGSSIATNFGPQFLLKLYLAGALGGSVFYLIHHAYMAATSPKGQGAFTRDPSRIPGLGASGAVNAIMLLEIFLHPKAMIYLELVIPVPAMLLGVFLIGKDILRITEGNSNISGSAHLGGAAVAAVAWARIRRGRFRF